MLVIASACSSGGDGAAPTTTETAATSDETVASESTAASTTTEAPATTSDDGEATSTTEATTTTVAAIVSDPHVVIGSLVIGSHDGTDWVPVDLTGEKPPELAGQVIIDRTGDAVTIEAVEAGCFPEVDFANWFAYQESGFLDGLAVRTNAAHDAWPRAVLEVSATDTHVETVRAWLDANGFPEHEATVRSARRVDIDGDGTDEVLIEAGDGASEMAGFFSPPGTYSAILMRRVAGTEVETVEVWAHLVQAELVDGFEEIFPDGAVPGTFVTIEDLVDVDGDGTYELVSSIDVHEGYTASLHTLGDTPAVVLETGCGV